MTTTTTASVEGKGKGMAIISSRPSYLIALIVAITNVISSSEAAHTTFPAADSMSNRHSRMASSPLWPSSDVHWADVPSGLGRSDGWSSWGAKKHSKEDNVEVGGDDGTMTMLEPRHALSAAAAAPKDASPFSEYAADEATAREHSERIPSAFSPHDPFENSDSTSTNTFVGGHFDSFRQSLRRGDGQGVFEFPGNEAGDTRSPSAIGATEGVHRRHHHFESKEPYERHGEAHPPAPAFGQNFYSDFNSANDGLTAATVADDEDDDTGTGFLPSSTPSHHGAFGHKGHAPFGDQIRSEREGSDDSGSGINYNINHGDFGNSYFASAGNDKKQPPTLDSRQHHERFDFGGFNGENTEVGSNRYSPDLLTKDSQDRQHQHNFDFLQRGGETKQQKHSQLYHHEGPEGAEDHQAQRNSEFNAEEAEYIPVDYRNPIQKLEHAAESATNYHSQRLAAPAPAAGGGPAINQHGHGHGHGHGHQHSSAHDVHPHDGPFHFSEPPVEGTANEEYRKHAAEHTSFMTKEEQKELDEAFARLKERKRQHEGPFVNAPPSPTTRFNRDLSWS